jgi:predicted phage terminase large subunit-like protein
MDLIVCMPPRHSKSRHSSELFPPFYLGHNPTSPVMLLSHTYDLSKKFGRYVRDCIASPRYSELFPATQLRKDQTAVGEWATTEGAHFFAAGVDGAIAGRGAGLLVVDDMVRDADAIAGQTRPEVFQRIYDWYFQARQRLMPGGAIVIVNTRWAPNDPTGLILANSQEDWEVITLPAVWPRQTRLANPADDEDDPNAPRQLINPGEIERTFWPEFWPPEEIFALRAELPPIKWEASYQQNPTAGGSTIFQSSWFKKWPKPDPPKHIEEIVVCIDPAFGERERADPAGIVIGGIFKSKRGEIGGRPANDSLDLAQTNLILLDAYESHAPFPDFKSEVFNLHRQWSPDVILVEDKASGVPLVQELSKMNIPVRLYAVSRGTRTAPNDKIARANNVSSIVRSGRIWLPDPGIREWAEKLLSQLTMFPMVPHDDMTDGFVMLLTYFRNFGVLTTDDDYEPDPEQAHSDDYQFGGHMGVLRPR